MRDSTRDVIRRAAALSGLAIALAAVPVRAQSVASRLTGRVTDPSRRAIAGAIVTVRSRENSSVRRAGTGADGRYELNALRPGAYSVRVEAPGFQAALRDDVALPLQGSVVVDVQLSPSLVEEVSVAATLPLLDPGNTAGGLFVGREEIGSLPLPGRVFTDLALLDASLRPVAPGTFYGERASVFTGNGQGGRSNSFLVDGLDNNDATVGSRTNALLSEEVIQEFRVLTDGFAAEFGRASGGVLNVLTRSGGNEVRGGVFFQGTSGISEPGAFVSSLPPVPDSEDVPRRSRFGGTVSGPLRKDRSFYFLAYEETDADEVAPFVGVQRDGTPGGRFLAPGDDRNAFLKLDWVPAPEHRVDVRLSWDRAQLGGVNVGGITTPEAGHRVDEDDVQIAASLTSVLGAHWVHEVRLLGSRSTTAQRANSALPGVDRPSGIFGGNHLQLQDRDEDRLQVVDNVSWFRGRHAFKFGLDVQRVRVSITTAFNPNGLFLYSTDRPFEPGDNGLGGVGQEGFDDDDDGTVDEVPDFDSYPLVYQLIRGSPSGRFDDTVLALFAQDQVALTDELRLSYGLRYDLDTFELDDRYAIRPGPSNGGADADRNNVAPRLSLGWTPSDRLLFRAGVGVFFDKVVLGFPAISSITGQQTLGLAFVGPLQIPCNENLDRNNCRQVLDDLLVSDPRFSLYFTTGDELDTPYTVQGSVGVETRVGRSTVFSAGVVRARGYHIPLLVDLNPVTEFFLVDNDPSRPFPIHRVPEIGSIASIETVGNSWYHAIELGLVRREGPLRYRVSYAYSRSEDQGSDPLRGGIYLPPDSDDLAGERARSDNDQRHRLVVSGRWETPFWGIVVSPVVTYATGMPFSVEVSQDPNGDGLNNDRPCSAYDPTQPCTGSNVRYRLPRNTGEDTPMSLVNDLRAELGLAPVTRLEEPDFLQADVRVSRTFAAKRATFEAFLQVINAFNRMNGGPVDGRVASRTFGQPIGLLGPPRQAEVGLRLQF